MRVPGTWNIPDEKKLAKGRTAVLARVIEFDETRVYSIDRFNKFTEKTPPAENNTIPEGTESLPQSLVLVQMSFELAILIREAYPPPSFDDAP